MVAAAPPAVDICLIVVNGSEFAMKVLTALLVAKDRLPAAYTTKLVPLLKLKKILPAPHLVPVLAWDDKVIADSTEILKFLDKTVGTEFFPAGDVGKKVAELEDEADNVLSAYLRYFAMYDEDGFSRCIKKQIMKMGGCIFGHVIIWSIRKTRVAKKETLRRAVPGLDVESREAVVAGLGALLQKYNDLLPEGDSGFLCGTPKPSGADVAVFGMLERLCSTSGDARFDPCLPDIIVGKPKLAAWIGRMERDFPVSFRGHKRPDEWKRPAALIADP